MPTNLNSFWGRLRNTSNKQWWLIVFYAVIGGIGVAATMSSALPAQWGLFCILIGYGTIGISASLAKNSIRSSNTTIALALMSLGGAIILLHFFGLLDWL